MEDKINRIWYQMNMKEITSEEARQQILDLFAVVGRSEQLVCDNHHADLEHFMKYSESICKNCKQKV